MTHIEKLRLVDDITYEISEKIGMLSRQGVFTFNEGVNIINNISARHIEWIKNSFSQNEYREYLASRMG